MFQMTFVEPLKRLRRTLGVQSNPVTLDYYRSIFVTLILTSAVPDPFFKKKNIYTFLQLQFITKPTLKI